MLRHPLSVRQNHLNFKRGDVILPIYDTTLSKEYGTGEAQ